MTPDDVIRRMERGFAGILARRYPGTVWTPADAPAPGGTIATYAGDGFTIHHEPKATA